MFRSKEPVVGDGQGAEGKGSEEQRRAGRGREGQVRPQAYNSIWRCRPERTAVKQRETMPAFGCPRTAGGLVDRLAAMM